MGLECCSPQLPIELPIVVEEGFAGHRRSVGLGPVAVPTVAVWADSHSSVSRFEFESLSFSPASGRDDGASGAWESLTPIRASAQQMGTRFIATDECTASAEYKQTIADAEEENIVHSERLTGVPVAVINTPAVRRLGLRAGPLARWMLRGRRTKHWMRTIYALKSFWQLRKSLQAKRPGGNYWQAGKSVSGIRSVEPVASIVRRFTEAARSAGLPATDADNR